MKFIYAICAVLGVFLALIVIGWLAKWYIEGKPDVALLMNFWDKLVDGKTLAAVGFVAYALVDKDRDGIPDKFQKEEEDKK